VLRNKRLDLEELQVDEEGDLELSAGDPRWAHNR